MGGYGGDAVGEKDDLWREVLDNPDAWWDNRSRKAEPGGNPRYPDFKHKESQTPLWIESRDTPAWAAEALANGGAVAPEPGFAGAAAAAPDAFALVALTGLFAGKVFKFQPNPVQTTWTIGRSEDNDVSLAGDDEVGDDEVHDFSYARGVEPQHGLGDRRIHACVESTGDCEDVASTNRGRAVDFDAAARRRTR